MKGMRVCWAIGLLTVGCASAESAEAPAAPQPAPEAAAPAAEPAAAAMTIWDGVYTTQQASRGQRTAQSVCFACHSQGEWTNPMFIRVWSGGPITRMWENIRTTMPYDSPGRLSAQEYTDVIAYMLQLNDAPAGDTELPANAEGMNQIAVTPES